MERLIYSPMGWFRRRRGNEGGAGKELAAVVCSFVSGNFASYSLLEDSTSLERMDVGEVSTSHCDDGVSC
ncbi:hypothetical protein MUK42_33900 [Musa troglodytarum]|uniref:Uncharacterized protein n=1 Tax=Musa troglodytarum TaxID=320322 RepID=A0A9E7I029_9LILI|nr:hypothetical protein MUK42_33900 [Musa troglodytarum]